MATNLRLLRTGEFACSCLVNEQHGRVLASTSGALWLQNDAGQLFWLARAGVPMHRRGASLPGLVPQIALDTRYVVQGDELVIGTDHIIELTGAEIWHAPLPARAAPGEAIAAALHGLLRSLPLAEGIGFARLLPPITSALHVEAGLPYASIGDPMLKRAEPLVLGLLHAAIADDSGCMREMAGGLVGLGPGLTPSGDDFLGGLLFALRTWELAFPTSLQRSRQISTEAYAARTNLISFTLLDDMANGHAMAPMHALVNGLISGASPDSICCHATDLTRVGHSTGWDLLTGLLAGLLISIRV